MVRRRRRWRVWQRHMRAAAFVFLDETGATTAMVSRYGRGPRSERLVDAAPQGRWRTTTFVAGLRDTGIAAPLVLDGPMTGEVLRKYVEEILVPTLHAGDVVVLDNLAAHKVEGVREAILAADAGPSTCRPARQVSTRSSSCPPSSRRRCGRLPPAAVRRSGPPSATCSTPSAPTNAAATSPTAATRSYKQKML